MSTLRTDTISNSGGTKSVAVNTVVDGSAKAWVNFNGTGTVAIRASFNVSSITDNGTGDYTVNFATAIADANYCTVGSDSYWSTFGGRGSVWFEVASVSTTTTTSVRVLTSGTTALYDVPVVNVAIFR